MKEKVLISTIVRNRAIKLPRYFQQIEEFIEKLSDKFEFSISIYENDSTDNSKKLLKKYDYKNFKESFVNTENINTQYYCSVVDAQRVINYANARNKTLEAVDINKFDWLLIVEPDIIYNFDMASRIITRSDLNFQPDIYSGIAVMNRVVYDKWATRRHQNEEWGDVFLDFKQNPIKEFWSTFSGVCLYNMSPFKNGIRFGAFNKRLNKYDCDTVVICENFREAGYNKIFANQSILPTHEQ